MAKKYTIELPDEFIHGGKHFLPGVHELESEEVYNELKESVERYHKLKKQQAEEADAMAMPMAGPVSKGVEGVDTEQLKELIDQAVEAKTVEIQKKLEEAEKNLNDFKAQFVEDDDEAEPNRSSGSEDE